MSCVQDKVNPKKVTPAKYTGNNCFEYSTQYTEFPQIIVENIQSASMSLEIEVDKTYLSSANCVLCDNMDGAGGIFVDVTGGEIRAVMRNSSLGLVLSKYPVSSLTDGAVITVSCRYSNPNLQLFINDTPVGGLANCPDSPDFDSIARVASRLGTPGRYYNGKASNFKIETNSTINLYAPMTEGQGLPWDVSSNGNHAVFNSGTGGNIDSKVPYNITYGFRRTSDAFSTTEPSGGYVSSFDPNTATIGDLLDTMATIIHSATKTDQTISVTEPALGWVRTFNPNTALVDDVYDFVATVANDMPTTVEAYTVTASVSPKYALDTENDSAFDVADIVATLVSEMQTYGVFG